MTKKPKSATEIAESEMPGWKAVEPSGPIKPLGQSDHGYADAANSGISVDAVMPSTRELRAKFLGADAASDYESDGPPVENDVDLINMKSGDIERTVGVNKRTGKIDWSQG